MTTVVCIKSGIKYGPEYVNRLAAMVRRHTTIPHRFLCLTDDPMGLECESASLGIKLPGWWAKLVLFQPHPRLAGDRVVYLDLDTVIVGNVDFLFAYQGDFAILRDFGNPKRYGSAVMAMRPAFAPHIWEWYSGSPNSVIRNFRGDQDWIWAGVPKADLWQDIAPGKIGSYKLDDLCQGPADFSLICFHGEPKPHQVNGWVLEAWR